ncbi:MAG TPA: TetR/AcrR family transcriptional regulator [Dissulfurispiraceae bacterium]|nr:TetR/AcrR family transcriptional regulator [Dissulfurispiraceae bacterium]
MPDGHQTTKEKILETALKLFSRKGYLGATTKEISAESGVAEVTLFRHFSSKEALFEEVLSTYSFLPALREIMPSVRNKPYEQALTEIASAHLDILCKRANLIKIMHSEVHIYPEKIRKIYFTYIDEIFRTLAAYFDEMQKKGYLRKFDSFLAARAFFGMFYAYFASAHIFMFNKYNPHDTKCLIREYVGFFVRGTLGEENKNHD